MRKEKSDSHRHRVFRAHHTNSDRHYILYSDKRFYPERSSDKLIEHNTIYQVKRKYGFPVKEFVCGFDLNNKSENAICDLLKKNGMPSRDAIVLSLKMADLVVDALAVNPDMTIELLKDFSECSPQTQAKIYITISELIYQEEKLFHYSGDDRAQRKIEATKAYMNALEEINDLS